MTMQHPFSALASEYSALLATMRVDPARERELTLRAAAVLALGQAHSDEWAEVRARTGVPQLWGLASFERESGSDYLRSPAQGDRWDRVSVNEPRGLGPYRCWGDACVAAYAIDKLDDVGGTNWTWPRACYEGELYNGFGPRAHGRHTGYLWAWTNIYTGGKYVADGKWDPDHVDEQCGMVPMMAALLRLDASLALADALPAFVNAPVRPMIPPREAPIPEGGPNLMATKLLQGELNKLGADPQLVVDGSYGRATRRAVAAFQAAHGLEPDGLAGVRTFTKLGELQSGI
jgi:lysozyme family protein